MSTDLDGFYLCRKISQKDKKYQLNFYLSSKFFYIDKTGCASLHNTRIYVNNPLIFLSFRKVFLYR